MKKTIILLSAFAALSCGSQKTTAIQPGSYTIESECPATGTCNFEIIKDSALVYKNNEATGRLYYEMVSSPGKSVLKYTYDKKKNPGAQDDFYREEIVIETNNDLSSLNNETSPKMLFGIFCYCKGTAGYYEIKDGSTSYKNNKISITVPKVIPNPVTTQFTVNTK